MINVTLRVLVKCDDEQSEYFGEYKVSKEVNILMPCEPMKGDTFWFDCGTDEGFSENYVSEWEVIRREYNVFPNHTDDLPLCVSSVTCLIKPLTNTQRVINRQKVTYEN